MNIERRTSICWRVTAETVSLCAIIRTLEAKPTFINSSDFLRTVQWIASDEMWGWRSLFSISCSASLTHCEGKWPAEFPLLSGIYMASSCPDMPHSNLMSCLLSCPSYLTILCVSALASIAPLFVLGEVIPHMWLCEVSSFYSPC